MVRIDTAAESQAGTVSTVTHPTESQLVAIIADDSATVCGERVQVAFFGLSRLVGNGQVLSASQDAGDAIHSDTDRSS